jgi:hypothetical protein
MEVGKGIVYPRIYTLSLSKLSLLLRMASNDNNDKHKLEEEAESSTERKRLWLSDDNCSDSPEEVSLEESSMNQLDTSEEKLLAKHVRDLFFGNNDDTTSPSLEPCTTKMPSSRVHSDPDDSDNDDFWM